MLAHRLRRWSNIKTLLFELIVFAGFVDEPSIVNIFIWIGLTQVALLR